MQSYNIAIFFCLQVAHHFCFIVLPAIYNHSVHEFIVCRTPQQHNFVHASWQYIVHPVHTCRQFYASRNTFFASKTEQSTLFHKCSSLLLQNTRNTQPHSLVLPILTSVLKLLHDLRFVNSILLQICQITLRATEKHTNNQLAPYIRRTSAAMRALPASIYLLHVDFQQITFPWSPNKYRAGPSYFISIFYHAIWRPRIFRAGVRSESPYRDDRTNTIAKKVDFAVSRPSGFQPLVQAEHQRRMDCTATVRALRSLFTSFQLK